ncbi:MAG: zinc-dependent metalloprotease [Actinomycetota bacterium]|nr:zinc-dependent metalloprotease [Actinomycetota bacterium]
MTDLPFGFGTTGGSEPDRTGDWAGKAPLFAELQKLMSWSGGPVNWDMARQLAISQAVPTDRPVTPAERAAVEQALRLADLWLDPSTSLPSGIRAGSAWSRVEWIERTLPVWSTLCDPVAARVVAAMGNALPSEAQAQAGALLGMLGQAGGLMFGAQVGQALAELSRDVLGATDIGLPLGPPGQAALVPANVAEFGAGLERPADEVRVYLALREAAHHRLFGSVPWLRQYLLEAVDAYARGITIDPEAIERALREIDPQQPESLQQALGGGMFEPENTPAQVATLARLETALALVEGWVDTVVSEVAGERLPGAAALGETVRRRRATGGPAEQTFATLVGLELRPRRLREAAALWAALAARGGAEARDALWEHPDLLPSGTDLDDPEGFANRSGDPLMPPEET